jgi:hypothetical protein
MVEQLAPLPGMAIAPGTPAGAGLMPGDAISVEPRGMPVGETVDPVSIPSGEVAPMVGVGLAIPPTWAIAALQTRSGESTAAINESLIGVLRLETPSPSRAPTSVSIPTIALASRKMARAREPFN